MSQNNNMIFTEDRDPLIKEYGSQLQRKYKCKKHITFLTKLFLIITVTIMERPYQEA